MDSTSASASTPLQNTSPPMNPAEVSQLQAAFAYQSELLKNYQEQLNKLQSANDHLTHYIRSLPSPSTSTVRLALPDKFDGSAGQCRGFIRQVHIYVESQWDQFSSEGSKCTFLMSLLSGKAIDWASAVWEADSRFQSSFEYLLQQLSEVFEYPEGGKDISTQLLHMSQGNRTAADFAIEFRTLAAQSGWNDVSLKAVFKQSLNLELQAELACKGEDLTFSAFITMAIKIDNLLRNTPKRKSTRQPFFNSRTAPSDHQEPMQINYAHLSDEERTRRRQQNLCYYCGETGHRNVECPHKARRSVSATSRVSVDQFSLPISKSFLIPVWLTTKDGPISLTALIDSGAALNLINKDIIKKYSLTTLPCVPTICITDVNNKPIEGGVTRQTAPAQLQIGLFHRESISFYIIDSPRYEIILGYPWLSTHDPVLSWNHGELTHWSEFVETIACPSICLNHVSQHLLKIQLLPPVLKSLPTIRTFQMCSARAKLHSYHLTVPGIAPSIFYTMPCHPRVRYTHYHAMNPRLWKITLKRLWTLVLLGPLPLQQQRGSSSLRRRMEVYDLAWLPRSQQCYCKIPLSSSTCSCRIRTASRG